jgi:dihydroorotate dehydrogenase electron transfer subunit
LQAIHNRNHQHSALVRPVKTGFIRVVENERLYGDTYVMWLAPGATSLGADLGAGAVPGQFLMLRCAGVLNGHAGGPSGASLGDDPLLPRAMSYHRIRRGEHGPEFSILYDVVGRGTAWLAARQPGDEIYAWGPLGRGYSLRAPGDNLLLVGGGIGIAPLLWLADEAVAKGKSVVLIDGARDEHGVFPAHLVPPEVEMVVTTQDGSAGRKGLVTDVFLDYYGWADQVFTCGPNPMFVALADLLRAHDPASSGRGARRRKPVQALLESPMGCGTGICYGCAVMDRRGQPRLVCKEGPRFELREIW